MSPNRAFDRAFQVVKTDPEVRKRFGDIVKAYGRDHGGRREGRRNFIEYVHCIQNMMLLCSIRMM
jgi:import inner membrane translocase subunit TIM21